MNLIDETTSGGELFIKAFMAQRNSKKIPFSWSCEELDQHIFKEFKPWRALSVDGEVIALVLFSQMDDLIEIHYLETKPECLRQGWMGKLLKALFLEFSTHQIWLDVHESNEAAFKMYSSLGFAVSGRREKYYKDGGGAVLMALNPSQSQ